MSRIRIIRRLAVGVAALVFLSAAASTVEAKPKGNKGGKGRGQMSRGSFGNSGNPGRMGMGHYKNVWKVDGRTDVAAKAALRERLRAGETIVDPVTGQTILPSTGSRFYRTDERLGSTIIRRDDDLNWRRGRGWVRTDEGDWVRVRR